MAALTRVQGHDRLLAYMGLSGHRLEALRQPSQRVVVHSLQAPITHGALQQKEEYGVSHEPVETA